MAAKQTEGAARVIPQSRVGQPIPAGFADADAVFYMRQPERTTRLKVGVTFVVV